MHGSMRFLPVPVLIFRAGKGDIFHRQFDLKDRCQETSKSRYGSTFGRALAQGDRAG